MQMIKPGLISIDLPRQYCKAINTHADQRNTSARPISRGKPTDNQAKNERHDPESQAHARNRHIM